MSGAGAPRRDGEDGRVSCPGGEDTTGGRWIAKASGAAYSKGRWELQPLSDSLDLVLAAAAMGQAALALSLLLPKSRSLPARQPLMVLLASLAVALSPPVVAALAPTWRTPSIAAALPASLLFGPALRLYSEALIAERPWRFEARHLRHVALPLLGVLAMALVLVLPLEVRTALITDGDLSDVRVTAYGRSTYVGVVMTFVFGLVMAWVVQTGFYVGGSIRALVRYRKRLKALFSSNEQRELGWLLGLIALLGAVAVVAILEVLSDNLWDVHLVSQGFVQLMMLAIVWALSAWGLPQTPGFEGRYQEVVGLEPPPGFGGQPEAVAVETAPEASPRADVPQKYQKSALTSERAQRIADKIEATMSADALHLDPDLSLNKLAAHLQISANYISQTFNETIGESFYDYVNRKRIEAALPRVLAHETSIATIAHETGFNSRSSFYKAFKKRTGTSPSEYRRRVSHETLPRRC